MQPPEIKLPNPLLVLAGGVVLMAVGYIAGRNNDYPQNNLLLLIEAFGGVVGFVAVLFAAASFIAPNEVKKYLLNMMKDDDEQSKTVPRYVAPPPVASSDPEYPLEWEQWAPTVIFGGLSLLILIVVRSNMEPGAMRAFLTGCCFIPALFGFFSSHLFGKEAWKGSAIWLERAGIILVAVIALVFIGYLGVEALGQLKTNINKLIGIN